MPNFSYKARDTEGKEITGTLEVADKAALVEKLRSMGYFVTSVEEEVKKEGVLSGDIFEKLRKVKPKDLMLFNNQLATMISAGLTLITSLNIMTQQVENKKLKEVVDKVREDVEGGNSFSGALEKHPAVFSKLFVSMVRAGEASGALETILHRLATFAEQAEEMKANVKTALTYPAFIIFAAGGVATFLVTGILPKFEIIFTGSGVALPLPTQILLGLSRVLRHYGPLVIAGISALLIFIFRYNKTKRGRYYIDRLKLKIPLIGGLLRKVAISRFARTLSTLIGSGVPILQALRIVQATVGNEVLATVLDKVYEGVNRGEGIAGTLKESKDFPPMVAHMIGVGEEAGTLDDILGKIADFYDREVSSVVNRLSSIIEPVLLVCLGIGVGFIALSLFMPMFNMMQTMG